MILGISVSTSILGISVFSSYVLCAVCCVLCYLFIYFFKSFALPNDYLDANYETLWVLNSNSSI